MKLSNIFYGLLIAATLLFVSACRNDHDEPSGSQYGKRVQIILGISASSSRADNESGGDNGANTGNVAGDHTHLIGSEGELIRRWKVFFCDKEGKVKAVFEKTLDHEQQDDTLKTEVETGDYLVYSFGNMAEFPHCDVGESLEWDKLTFTTLANSREVPPTGLAMSNVEYVNVDELGAVSILESFAGKELENHTGHLHLIPLRAKIRFTVTNEIGVPIKVKRFKLYGITDADQQIPMFPTKMTDIGNHSDLSVVSPHNSICFPDFDGLAQKPQTTAVDVIDREYNFGSVLDDREQNFELYINESVTPTDNEYRKFIVEMEIESLVGKNPGEPSAHDDTPGIMRYAMFTDTKWNYIARNDFRIVPLKLRNYTMELWPEMFTAIGVYPSVERDNNELFTLVFKTHDHFHLAPMVFDFDGNICPPDKWEYVEGSLRLTPDMAEPPAGMFADTDTSEYGGLEGNDPHVENQGFLHWDTHNKKLVGRLAKDGTAFFDFKIRVREGLVSYELHYNFCIKCDTSE